MALARAGEGRLTPRQLADAIDVDAPTASGLLERLERDGWIESAPNPDDGRSRFVALTEKASGVLPEVVRAAGAVSDEATACLTPDEVRSLEQLLSKLCASGASVSREQVSR